MEQLLQKFKNYFYRDFPFLPQWVEGVEYKRDEEVYFDGLFYVSQTDKNTNPLTSTEHWQPIEDDVLDYVTDSDIERAIEEALVMFPNYLGMPDQLYDLALLYLVAHLLVNIIRMSNSGLASQLTAIVTGKSVGSVSQQYGLPQQLLNSAWGYFYITSQYGLRYLTLVHPYTTGAIGCVSGSTTP